MAAALSKYHGVPSSESNEVGRTLNPWRVVAVQPLIFQQQFHQSLPGPQYAW